MDKRVSIFDVYFYCILYLGREGPYTGGVLALSKFLTFLEVYEVMVSKL